MEEIELANCFRGSNEKNPSKCLFERSPFILDDDDDTSRERKRRNSNWWKNYRFLTFWLWCRRESAARGVSWLTTFRVISYLVILLVELALFIGPDEINAVLYSLQITLRHVSVCSLQASSDEHPIVGRTEQWRLRHPLVLVKWRGKDGTQKCSIELHEKVRLTLYCRNETR